MSLAKKEIESPALELAEASAVETAHWNQAVARNRGAEWRRKLLLGRLEAQSNPSHIRISRMMQNFTQKDVAQSVALSVTTYMAIEAGNRFCTEENAKKICELLGIPMEGGMVKFRKKYLARKVHGNLLVDSKSTEAVAAQVEVVWSDSNIPADQWKKQKVWLM